MKNRLILLVIMLLLTASVFGGYSAINDAKIPVLTYHCIADEPYTENAELFVTSSAFARQLDLLAEMGYTTIFADDIDRAADVENPVAVTFDDGYEDNFLTAYPLLKERGMKATIFVISSMIGRDGYLTAEQIREMSESGVISIQSHTETHRSLTELTEEELIAEFSHSKTALATAANREVRAVAYPYGAADFKVVRTAKEFFDVGFITTGRTLPFDSMRTGRITINRSTSIEEFKAYFD